MKEMLSHRRTVDNLVPTGTYSHMVDGNYLDESQMYGSGVHVHAVTPHFALKEGGLMFDYDSKGELLTKMTHPNRFFTLKRLGLNENKNEGYLVFEK